MTEIILKFRKLTMRFENGDENILTANPKFETSTSHIDSKRKRKRTENALTE